MLLRITRTPSTNYVSGCVLIHPCNRSASYHADCFVPRWNTIVNCAVAGPFWIDTTLTNKGLGVKSICRTLGLDFSEVMAFGDNYNDVSMLDIVGYPYIMKTAAEPLLKKHLSHTARPEDVLRDFLRAVSLD